MKSKALLTLVAFVFASVLILGQAPAPQGQAPQGQAAAPPPVVCVGTPQFAAQQAQAAAAQGQAGGAQGQQGQGRGQGGQAQGRGAAPPQGPQDVTTTAIPGVVAAGLKWTKIWQTTGNNADGVVADKDGNLLTAQEDNNAVVKIDKDDKASVLVPDTHGAGSLAFDRQWRLLAVQRMPPANGVNANTPNAPLTAAIVMLLPEKKILANTFTDGTTLPDRPNDLAADSKGGAYFTQGCVYYASPNGKITLAGDDLRTNGIVLSPDNRILYVTNGAPPAAGGRGAGDGAGSGGAAGGGAPAPTPGTIAAFDVQPDGTLRNRRTFTTLQSGNGDGSAVDSSGRLYVTAGPTVQVYAPDGKHLGTIPTPTGVISVGFAGPDRKTLYIVANGATGPDGQPVTGAARTIYRLPMLAEGLKNRGK